MSIATITPFFFNTNVNQEKIDGIIAALSLKLLDASVSEAKTRKYVATMVPIPDNESLTFDEHVALKNHFKKAGWAVVKTEEWYDRDSPTSDKTLKISVTLFFPLTFKEIINRLTNSTKNY